MKNTLNKLSLKIAGWAGSAAAFALAILLVIFWMITGPYYHYSNTWLIFITVVTDVIIFLMVF